MFCRCMRASTAKPNFENEDDEKEVTRLKRWKGVIDPVRVWLVRFLQETVRISAALLHRTYVHVKQLLQMTMVTVYQWFVIAL